MSTSRNIRPFVNIMLFLLSATTAAGAANNGYLWGKGYYALFRRYFLKHIDNYI